VLFLLLWDPSLGWARESPTGANDGRSDQRLYRRRTSQDTPLAHGALARIRPRQGHIWRGWYTDPIGWQLLGAAAKRYFIGVTTDRHKPFVLDALKDTGADVARADVAPDDLCAYAEKQQQQIATLETT
jgi:hypothetical protein